MIRAVTFLLFLPAALGALPAPIDLRLEYLPSPVLGITELKPRFSWVLDQSAVFPFASSTRNVNQAAYKIVVTETGGTAVWDSGEVLSDRSYGVVYNGTTLHAETAYSWSVQVCRCVRMVSYVCLRVGSRVSNMRTRMAVEQWRRCMEHGSERHVRDWPPD